MRTTGMGGRGSSAAPAVRGRLMSEFPRFYHGGSDRATTALATESRPHGQDRTRRCGCSTRRGRRGRRGTGGRGALPPASRGAIEVSEYPESMRRILRRVDEPVVRGGPTTSSRSGGPSTPSSRWRDGSREMSAATVAPTAEGCARPSTSCLRRTGVERELP